MGRPQICISVILLACLLACTVPGKALAKSEKGKKHFPPHRTHYSPPPHHGRKYPSGGAASAPPPPPPSKLSGGGDTTPLLPPSEAVATTPPPPPPSAGTGVSALFVFGDSLVDVGNNNYIPSLARANFYPNGIDYIGGQATGRFCNGKTVLDFVGDALGFPPLPPYLSLGPVFGVGTLKGVNYASGAGGILDSTGYNYIDRIPFGQQLTFFQNTISQYIQLVGKNATTTLLNRAIYAVVIGSNDYINNYLLNSSAVSRQYTPAAYQQLLINTLSSQLKTLYNLGARKIVVSNIGPLGCIPSQIAMDASNVNGLCITSVNNLVLGYNAALQTLLNNLRVQLPEATILYANVYDKIASLVQNPQAQGFQSANTACCGGGRFGGQLPCLPTAVLCPDRRASLFWDAFHPSDATNVLLAASVLDGGINEISPINVRQLAAA